MTTTKTRNKAPHLKAVPKRKPRVKIADLRAEIAKLQDALTNERPTRYILLTAVALPIMAGALEWIAATHLSHAVQDPTRYASWLLALACGIMTGCAIRVSLPHVCKGIERKLSLPKAEARALAIVFDLAGLTGTIVLHVGANSAEFWLALGLMGAGLAASIAYNVVGLKPDRAKAGE